MNAFSKSWMQKASDTVNPQNTHVVLEAMVAGLFLLFAVAFNSYHLYPEMALNTPPINDEVLHLLMLEGSTVAVRTGQNMLDFWLAPVSMGYPLVRHYQHLPYVIPALLHRLFQETIPLQDLLIWIRYLLLSCFPLSIYWSMRRFGFARLAASMAALVATLLATNGLYGFDFASYLWSGYGLYTQLWGMFLLPLAIAHGYVALGTGKGHLTAAVLLAATMLSHLVMGYIALVSIVCLVLLPVTNAPAKGETITQWRTRVKHLALLLFLAALITAYFWIPFLLDRTFMNRSVWEDPWKVNGYGHAWTFIALSKGELFDYGRFPSLTILAALGMVVCLRRWADERYRVPIVLFIVWILLYCGRPTWGVLLDLLPLSRDLHLHRLIAGIHLSGIYLMGLGLAPFWHWAVRRESALYWTAPAALTALLLLPVYRERGAFLAENTRMMRESQVAMTAEEPELTALITTLRQLPPGRVYAGKSENWGESYRIGAIPVYTVLNSAGLDMVGYLYHALSLNADVQLLFDETRPEHYELFNVRYVVAHAQQAFPDFVEPLADFGRHRLYQVKTSGYFDLVGSEILFAGDRTDFFPAASAWLKSELPGQKQHPALVLNGRKIDTYQASVALSQGKGTIQQFLFRSQLARGEVISETVANNAYTARINVARESVLLFKATYHPNWHATVDGREVTTMMLMPSYVGVNTEPGTHIVHLSYRPRPFKMLLLIVGQAGVVMFALLMRQCRREGFRVGPRS